MNRTIRLVSAVLLILVALVVAGCEQQPQIAPTVRPTITPSAVPTDAPTSDPTAEAGSEPTATAEPTVSAGLALPSHSRVNADSFAGAKPILSSRGS